MKNKKLVLTVLSTAVVSSMTASAFAAPQEGIYVGGDVGKYYSLEAFVSAKNFDGALDQINKAGLEQVLYVSADGLAATLDIIADAEDFESVLEEVTEETLEYISGLDGFDVVKVDGSIEDEPYFPEEDIDMPEVAKIELALPAGKDAEITVGSATDGELALVARALDKDGEEVLDAEIMFMSDKPAVAMVDAMSGKVKAVAEGTATITAKSGDVSKTFLVTVKKAVDPVPTGLVVESAMAIDGTHFKVMFNKEVQGVLPANFVVTDKATGTRNYVKAVELSEDKKSATIELYDVLVADKAYVVATSDIKDASGVVMVADSDEFTYTIPVPASIAFKGTKLPTNNALDLDNYIEVKDGAGNVLTGQSVVYTANVAIAAGNVIDTDPAPSVLIINASITKADGTVISTGNKVFTVEAAVATSINTFGLVSGTAEVSTLFVNGSGIDADGHPVMSVGLGATFNDQYGVDIPVGDEVYTSLNPTVLSVTADGVLTPIQPGKAFVRVTKGTLTKTIEVEVKANPVATTLEAETAISVVGAPTAPAGTINVKLKDQYGNLVGGNTATTVAVADAAIATVNPVGGTNVVNGELALTVQGQAAGTTKVTITVGTLVKEVTVTSVQAGNINGFSIEATDATINLNTGASPADTNATIKVYQVDANGNKLADLTATAQTIANATLSFELPATGALIQPTATPNVFENKAANTATGTTEVTIKAGTLVIGKVNINTVNTTDTVATRELVSPIVRLNTSTLVTDFNTNGLQAVAKNIKMTTKSGAVLDNAVTADLGKKVDAIKEVITNNTSAVTVTTANGITTDVDAVPVSGAKQTATLVVTFKDATLAPVAFDVEVYDTAPVAPTVAGQGAGLADGRINIAEAATTQTVRVNLGTGTGVGDTVNVNVGSTAMTPVTLTSTNIGMSYVDVTIPANTFTGTTAAVTATVTDVAGGAPVASAPYNVTVDLIAPTFTGAALTSSSPNVVLTFSEAVYTTGSLLNVTDLTIANNASSYAGATLSVGATIPVGSATNTITATADVSSASSDSATVVITPAGAMMIVDVAGNPVVAASQNTPIVP